MAQPLLEVEHLGVEFHTDTGVVQAVNDVSFSLAAGETLGVVGESGSGKSVTSLALLGLIPQPPGRITSGRALLAGNAAEGGTLDLLHISTGQLRKIRGRRVAMIFQDPMTALNPFLTVGEQLEETTRLHLKHTAAQARRHAADLLDQMGIPGAGDRLNDYPHQFSGGMRQRVMIAMALSCQPEILIADEPTTALDVTIQAQILELIATLQKQHGTAVILITHALGIVAGMCQRVQVMYGGRIVEEAGVDSLFYNPCHPYSLGLLESIPRDDDRLAGRLRTIEGQPPNMWQPPSGCAFHPRCRFRQTMCDQTLPALVPRADGGSHRCLFNLAELGGRSPLALSQTEAGT